MLEAVATAVTLGAIYFLASCGMSFVYGTAGFLNLAHGQIFALGPYVAFALISILKLDLYVSCLLVIIISGLFGLALYSGILMHIRSEGLAIITTLSLLYLLQELFLITFRETPISLPKFYINPPYLLRNFSLNDVILMILALITVTLLMLFVERSYLGKIIQAVAQDKMAAELMGIKVKRINALAMSVSCVFASLAGVLYCQIYSITPLTGSLINVLALAMVVVGGLGSIRGCFIASFALSFLTVFSILYLGIRWSLTFPLIILIVMILVKPTGLFGRVQ